MVQNSRERNDFCCRKFLSLFAFDLVSVQMSTFREILLVITPENVSLSPDATLVSFLPAHTPYQKVLVYLLVYCLVSLPKNKNSRRVGSLSILLTSVSSVPRTMIVCKV